MSCNLPALRSTFVRHSTAGNVVLLFLAIWMLLPYALDRYRGEPSIKANLVLFTDGKNLLVQDDIKVAYSNRGSRTNYAMDEYNRVICSKNSVSFWDANRTIVWYLPGFIGCATPDTPFKVCSLFSIRSRSGIERKFGSNQEFCSEFVTPTPQG